MVTSVIFSAISICCSCAVAAATQNTAGGAVVTAAGAADDPNEAAELVQSDFTGELRIVRSGGSDIFSDFDMCSCVVAAAAQNTAGGAVVTAAGGATDFSVELQSAVRNFIGELRGDSNDIFSAISI